jgi:hypothetical protein
MKIFKFTLLFFLVCIGVNAQQHSVIITKKPLPDSLKPWKIKHKIGVDVSEVTFVNWSAGGSNSISALTNVVSTVSYRKERISLINRAVLRLGGNKAEGQRIRKTDDAVELSSNFGYQKDTMSNWYYSARFNIKTQLIDGYNYPNREKRISKFFAPGYIFAGIGSEYGRNIEEFSVYFSPLTYKGTFVLDRNLSNAGAFGVDPAVIDAQGNIIKSGERVRSEIGILFQGTYETNLFENIDLRSQVELYTDYLNSFGNVDIDWEFLLDFKVNSFVKAGLGSHIIYDDDIDAFEEKDGEQVNVGPKVQWKQILGVGVVVVF